MNRIPCHVIEPGTVDYPVAWRQQKRLLRLRQEQQVEDILMILQHPPVITCGRSAQRANITAETGYLKNRNIPVFKSDRGGDVTLHLPGQLVAYPLFDLRLRAKKIIAYIRRLEDVQLFFLSRFGIPAERRPGKTGAWAENRKIGFIGIGISKWISYHGLSINIDCDLSLFGTIRACGIAGIEVGSVSAALGYPVDMQEAAAVLKDSFREVFGLEFVCSSINPLLHGSTLEQNFA